MESFKGKTAVVTGGASGIGKALVKALLEEGSKVVVADVEQGALDAVLEEFKDLGEVRGKITDVSKPEALEALADYTWDEFGGCHLLFNNAGVSAPNALVWETTPNDWKWVHGVNINGVAFGIQAFVPRMIASGEEGYVINTSSGDGGISPLPFQSVYASSKAAVSIITECLAAQLQGTGTKLNASIFYPSGGLLATGIWTTARNRPAELAREKPGAPAPDIEEFKALAESAGMELQFQDLDELARFCLQGIRDKRFVIMIGHEESADTLQFRADQYRKCDIPLDMATTPVMM